MKQNILTPHIDFKQESEMYKSMYLKLFNSVADALTVLDEKGDVFKASYILKQAQRECEEIYISV